MSDPQDHFPIRISKRTLNHQGGTKSYQVMVLSSAKGDALQVNRWGKINQLGSLGVDRGNTGDIARSAEQQLRAKMKRGYRFDDDKDLVAHDLAELKRLITLPVWKKLGADNIQFLVPGADTRGVSDPINAEFEQTSDGKYVVKEKPPLEMPETVGSRTKDNPNWGTF